MSFCRITGRSRGLPKPNYFPLLAPISPADAKRCCRITGKSYGLPSHHYIPVLLTARSSKAKCKITNVSGELGPHHYSPEINYGNRKHEILPDYRYIFPVLDGSTEAQRCLMEMLLGKQVTEDKRYVYTVQERRCSLVFSAQMEAAVRDGDVRDVMLAKDSDTVLIKTKHGRSVSMDFKDFTEDVEMYEGEGPNAEVLKQREIEELEEKKKKRKRTAGLSSMKKIFENKEKLAEVEEIEEEKLRVERKAKKAKFEEIKHDVKTFSYNSFDAHHMRSKSSIIACASEWRDQMHPIIETWDWETFEKDVTNERIVPKATKLPTPVKITPHHCDAEIYEVDRNVGEVSIPLEIVPCVNPLKPIKTRPSETVLSAVKEIPKERLTDTADVIEKLVESDKVDLLPTMENLAEVVKNIKKGKREKVAKISGLTLDINKAKTFVPGQVVNTPQGPVFVPGQTVETPIGPVFVPGLSVNTPAGPGLIPGHIVTNENTNEPFFLAGQVLQTSNGEEFVCGQTMKNKDDTYRFAEGQTVLSEEGLKFVPGKIINTGPEDVFVPGQTLMTPEGVQFIPGQTMMENDGITFTPGQNAKINNEWQFVPGQVLHQDDELHFVPGATIATPNGLKFVPGQTVSIDGETCFIPGITKTRSNNELEFVPGTTVETIDGPKFIEGQLVHTDCGEKFMPGKTIVQADGHVEFSVAKSIEDITFSEGAPVGLPIDIKTCSLSEESLYVFGHMVQTAKGIEFYPGPRMPKLEGKVVPGRLVKNEANESRFVPGMMVEGIFVPGQIVFTENGEQFVPGQVVDTADGPKFVPGQVVNTKSGPKFVPGQTIHTIDGPRFVPGQIIETKAGPTFIPGQVISTEDEGSRFVPGQVVDTEEGPRFVPGRVIETDDNGVTFIPGQIVQTPEGLKFVAPDLTEGDEGLEFSVQSFVVTPEELKLLKVKTNPNDTTSTKGELTIDTNMLRQLSEAGMSIGRQVPAELPAINVVLNHTRNAEALKAFVTDFGLKDEVANQLMDVITSIIEMSAHLKSEIHENHKENGLSNDMKKKNGKKRMDMQDHVGYTGGNGQSAHQEHVKNSIAAAVLAALVTAEQFEEVNNNNSKEKYQMILKSIDTILGKTIDEDLVSAMFNILQKEEDKELLREEILENSSQPKVELIKIAVNNTLHKHSFTEDDIIEKFGEYLSSENEVLGPAFKNISKIDSSLLHHVLGRISESISFVKSDREVTETLQKAIVCAVQEASTKELEVLFQDKDKESLKELITQSVGLARILGLRDVASNLLSVVNDEDSMSKIASDPTSLNILKRLTVMRKLADNTPSLHSALHKLETDPSLARTDPKLRDLVRESAALMIVPEETPLMTSEDVPLNLLDPENSLAMEDFLFQRRKQKGALLIMKKGLQAVVPREASRAVLTGEVAYTVLDENGIRHFEPLHVFSALNLSQPTAHRFSMYSCPVVDDDDEDLQSFTGYCNISNNQKITRLGGWSRRYSGVLLDRENTRSRMSSLETTPSYKRYPSRSMSSSRSRSSCSRSPPKVEDVVVASADYAAAADDEVSLKAGDIVEVLDTKSALGSKKPRLDPELDIKAELLDASAAKHKLAVRPKKNHPRKKTVTSKTDDAGRWLVRVIEDVQEGELRTRQGYVPADVLKEKQTAERDQTALAARRQAVVRELVETEEEFGRDMQQVVTRYMKPIDKATTPKAVFDNRELLFSNFRQICEFHNTILLEGIKYYASEPKMLGRALLRMEREFDKHVGYCRDEPRAQHLLATDPVVNKYFQDLADSLRDDKGISEHLKLPIQRINDYQLLLKELVKYSKRLGEDCSDLQKALELFLSVPNRATDNKFIASIEGFRGNIYKLGRLLTHDWFTVSDTEGKSRERYVFLFKARVLICKVKKVGDDRSVFVLKDIVKLPEVEIKENPEEPLKFTLCQKDPPLTVTLAAHKEQVKTNWLAEIRKHASDLVALAEHAADDLQVEPEGVPAEPEEKKKKRDHAEVAQAEAVDTKEKRSRVEETTQVATTEEAQQLKTKRKASIESEVATKISKSEVTEVSSVSETQQSVKVSSVSESSKVTEKTASVSQSEQTSQVTVVAAASEVKVAQATSVQSTQQTSVQSSTAQQSSQESSVQASSQKTSLTEQSTAQSSTTQVAQSSSQATSVESKTQEATSIQQTSSSVEQSSQQATATEYKTQASVKETTVEATVVASQQSTNVQEVTTQQSVVEETKESTVEKVSSTGAEVTQQATSTNQTVTTEEVGEDEMSRYSRSTRLSGEYSSSSRKLSGGGRYESSSTYDGSGLTSSYSRRESGSRLESSKYESGGAIEGTASSRYESKYSSKTEGGSKYGIESSYESKTESGSKYGIEYDSASKIDSIASKYGIEANVESKSERSAYAIEGDSASKIDSIASKYASKRNSIKSSVEGAKVESSLEAKYESKTESSAYGIESDTTSKIDSIASKYASKRNSIKASIDGDKVESISSTTESSYETVKNGDSSYESKYSKKSIANGSVSTGYESARSISKSESQDGKPIFTKTLAGQNIEPGENAIFECLLRESKDVKVTWLKDNKPLTDRLMDRCSISLENDGGFKLELKHCRESDAGVYTAIAENLKGNAHCTAQLVVQELTAEERRERNALKAPYFLVALKDTEIMENTYLRFMVHVKGDPNPDVKFYRDDKEILTTSESDRVSIIRTRADRGCYELVIADVLPSDAGRYSCRAMNIYGEVTSEATVTVVDDKNIFGELPPGGEGLLAKGEKPTFTWKRDGQTFDPEERFKVLLGDDEDSLALVFQHVKPEDAGIYTCVAKTSTGNISCSAELTVQGAVHELHREPEKPSLVIEHREAIVSAGASAMLELVCKGYPKPNVVFKHKGKDIEADTRHKFLYEDEESMSLVIKNVSQADAGEYQVTASNELGEDTTTMHLIVKAAPKIKKKIENQTCMVSSTHTVTIEIEGAPAPDVTFYKDGVEIKSSDRISIVKESDEVYKITIKDAKLTDTGSYSVVAKNEVNQCSDFWQWHVTSPPKVIKKMGENKVCEEKETVTFKVETQSEPAPTVSWYKNKVELSESSTVKISSVGEAHSLVITSAAKADAGEYSCEIRNIHGSTSDSCVLNVKSGPYFTQKLKDTTASEGDVNIEFTVAVEAYPEPTVKWYLGDVEITEKKSVFTRVDSGNTHKLILKEVSAEYSGNYSCRVSNVLGEDSCSATFTVNRKPRFTKSLIDMTVDAGQTLKLDVEVEGCPEPRVKWYKDGKEVNTDARIKIERDTKRLENYHLSVTLVKEEDGGEYEVRAENEFGSVSSKSTVTVHTPPTIKGGSMKDGHAYESLPLVYSVEVSGTPKPTIRWLHDGKEVKPCGRVHITNDGDLFKLEIDSVQMKDAGKWQCEIVNNLGKQVQTAQLSVSPESEFRKPKFTSPLEAQRVVQKEPVSLQAVCTADPLPHVAWLLNGVELTPSATIVTSADSKDLDHGLKECTFTLQIPTGRHTDTGEYTIQATNKYGVGESSARLDILLRPEIEGLKDVTAVPFEETTFIANVRANPIAEVKWHKDGYVIQPSSRYDIVEDVANEKYQLTVKKVGVDDGGVYTLVAKNEVGETSQQAKLIVHTGAPVFTKPLQKQSVKDYDDITLKVRCDGVPKPDVEWYRDGTIVANDERHTVTTEVGGQVDSELEIKHFNASDAGKYKVRAVSLAGEAVCEAAITLEQKSPGFAHKLERQKDVDEGDLLELKAKVDGSPMPTAKWFKDGAPLSPDDSRVQQTALPDGTVKLSIEHVTPADCGAYKLVISNPHGDSSALCAVAVNPTPRKPSFSQELEDVKAVVGQPLKLEARVMAFPAPEIKWFKDGLPVRPSQAVNFVNQPGGLVGLSIDCCKPEDAGNYSLTVTNRLGEVASKAKVEVGQKERKPAFIAELQPTKVIEGFPVKLEVKILGHPPPTLKWTHNGKEIVPDGQHIRVVSQPDGTHALLIDRAAAPDAGQYGVVAANDKGETASNADLTVASRTDDSTPQERPRFIHGLRDLTAEEGQPLSVSVPFVGNPVPEVTWTKDGVPLKPSEKIRLTCDGKRVGLEISSMELPDAGVYSIKLVNPLGEDCSDGNINVRKVYSAPTFSQKFTDLQQLPTFDAKFPARVFGLPFPEITWYKDGAALRPSDKYSIKRDGDAACLYVRDLTPADAGRYKCVARNREGEATCEANLEVVDKIARKQKVEPPEFLKKIGDIEVFRGMSAKFTACVTGTPEPDVEWYRNDERLFPCERIRMDKESTGLLRLTIGGVDPTDVGTYRCRVYNPHGEASCSAQLTYDTLEPHTSKRPIGDQYSDFDKMKKTGIPMPLADRPIISRMADRHLTLGWKPSIPHGPRFPVTYQVEMCEVPDGDWFTARTGLRSCVCDIRNLEPFRDYKFRIRVENKYGVSDPSPFAITHRSKLEPDPPKFIPYLEPGIDFRPETSPYFPKDFDIERPPHDGYAQAPKFLRQETDSQYGVKGHNVNLFWFVYGYPKPKMTYYFNDEPIEIGGRYDWSYTRNGQATLFINKMLERDAGWYEAVATNEHGQARQRVRLEVAEYPQFIRRPEELVLLQRHTGRLEARVTGVPYPDIKWYKDWQPLAPSARIKIQFIEPDICQLVLHDAILKDEGLYSISARNVAGSVSSSAMIYVEESEHEYSDRIREHPPRIKPSTKPFGDFYDLGDELGRGVQGVVYHAAERLTGRNYAAKIMHGHSALKPFMKNELDILNLLNDRHLVRLHDAYEHEHTLALVLELAGGGELVRDRLLRGQYYTERDIAGYIRQVLRGLKYMHDNSVAHLGLTIGELLLSHAGSDELKLCDFGLSRRIQFNKHASLDYGMPEFVAPEVAAGEGVSFAADLWSLGIITYILLSGHSPFRGVNDRETLTRIREGRWDWHDEEWWSRLSTESRDFISKLLVYNWHERMDVNTALSHPWLTLADKIYQEEYQITTDRLRNYYNLYRDWTSNAQCRTWFRRKPLSGAYEHPSKMVYPPGETYTPEATPDRDRVPHDREPGQHDINFKQWDHPDWEVSATSESHYQNGPDTYLLQLRDTQFPVRLREYMKVACDRSPGYSLNVFDTYDPRTPIIRERRRFTDIMDEEIDDERRERINNYGTESYTIRRLRHELGTRLDSYAEAQALMESKKDGQLPFFREKPQLLPVREGENAQLSCFAVGDPKPSIQWFKNDMVIAEGQRIKIIEDDEGRSTLRFEPAKHHDIGFYKVVARNKVGQTVARTRIVEATTPDAPDSPTAADVSDCEVLLRWKQPKYDGNSPVICYSLQYKAGDSVEWRDVASNIDHEFFVVRNLSPDTSYQFRLSSRNRIGWSDKGIPTHLVKTKQSGAPKIEVTKAMKHLQQITESGQEVTLEENRPKLDYSLEDKPVEWESSQQFTERYSFVSELWRGKFSIVVKGIDRSNDNVVVSKILENRPDTEVQIQREFECLRRLRHERISNLIAAYQAPGSSVSAFILEKLQGADILTYLSSRHDYTEQMVATIVTQILDGLQYLHWRGYCHLDLQPDNVVMASVRSIQVKLIDFGSAHKVTKLGTSVPQVGDLEYKAPEIINDEPAYPQTDIWSVGVLTYIMLSGVSPFKGADDAETKQNISFVRFRFEHLYKEITQEATRFLMFLFKKVPLKRPLAEECYEHRWLTQSDFMNKKRERAVFLGNRLKEFSDSYHERKAREASQADTVAAAFGGARHLVRSNSIQDELLTTFNTH
ncbi:obscurin isoform X6 [Spodoptera frugiperda]|uniref:Hemolin n=1 Tax=Spodoptera frugiperda TaxID=7108 RepID=A0A9R0D954_SPOFR|nr:obscurin isoform X6 [Spodoptera frugiperda]